MISLGNRRQGSPILIKGENTTVLERVPLDERQFQENWLQNLIDNNPQLLPIDDIESGFAPLISVGREIATSVGYIDNLFISTSGYITLVETKLWRNPEAKREVVGQIIDYAKELSNWDYSMLDNAVKLSSQNNLNIIKAIKKYDDVDAEQEKIIIDKKLLF